MHLYKKLNWPTSPIKLDLIEELFEYKKNMTAGVASYHTIHYDVNHYINPQLIGILSTLNIKPLLFVHFGSINNQITSSVVHTDLNYENGAWMSMPMGINWELTPGTTTFNWYDPLDCIKVMPLNPDSGKFNSCHYETRFNRDVSQMKKIATLEMQRHTPYLLKTDVAHQIVYTCDTEIRMGISLRFAVADIPTWERALQVFDQHIINT